jgi:hypothetical protein
MKISSDKLVASALFIFAIGFILGTRAVYKDAMKAGAVLLVDGHYTFKNCKDLK